VSGYFDRIEQQLVQRVEAGERRGSRFRLRLNMVAPAVSVAVALVVVVVFLSVHGSRSPASGSGGAVELVYQAEPTPQVPHVTLAALARTVEVMHERLNQLGVAQANISTLGGDEITVRLAPTTNVARVEQEIGTTGQLYFYDWEANVLLPNGSPVASELLRQDPTALTISQGAGEPGAGSTTLYAAVLLASKQPQSKGGSQISDQYYLFGRGGTPACAAIARFYGVVVAATGQHCLIAGPDYGSSRQAGLYNLENGLPAGLSLSDGQVLVVKPGTVVLQAVPANPLSPPKAAAPNTQFYVLRDNVELTGNEITNPRQSTDAGGNPDVQFGFTGRGAKAFTGMTAAIAHRGSEVSLRQNKLQQHFAVVLDGVLVTVPQIDYTQYPDGLPSDQGAEIDAGLTLSSARAFAFALRVGALPVGLKLISHKHVPAPAH
jgi:SecD/SecF fusion protein